MPNIREFNETDDSLSVGGSIGSQEEQVQSFVKQMLQSRLFIGSFQEKRYVDSLQSYRDVIVVAKDETDLIRDLEVVKKRLHGYYGQNHWIGITGPDMIGAPVGHCLWVELPNEIFGSYWYKISKIRFRPHEILLRIKVIRPVSTTAVPTTDSYASIHRGSSNTCRRDGEEVDDSDSQSLQECLSQSFTDAKNVILSNFQLFCNTVITIQNTKEAIKFISVLLVTLATGLLRFVEYLGDYSIKFMHETSVFLKAATPIIIACINLIGKIIGGFYLLILGMWRDRKVPPPVYQSPYINRMNPMITNGANAYNTVYFKRSLPAPPRNRFERGARITPLD